MYQTLCEESLETAYFLPKKQRFTKVLRVDDPDDIVMLRLKSIARQNKKLGQILQISETVSVVQKPNTYGWFDVFTESLKDSFVKK